MPSLSPSFAWKTCWMRSRPSIKAESLVQPAILLLEDAHWLDDESRQFLDQLTRNVDDFPFAVVVTQRPVDGTAAVATDDGSHTLIQLNGLDDEQI